jgi:L-fuconolactonase
VEKLAVVPPQLPPEFTLLNRCHFLTNAIAASLTKPLRALIPPSNPLLIDAHVYVWKTDPRLPFAVGARPTPQDATAETLLDLMHANGVAHTVLTQVIHYRWDNSYLAHVLRQYSRYFVQSAASTRPTRNPRPALPPDRRARLPLRPPQPRRGPENDWIRGPLMSPLWRRCA